MNDPLRPPQSPDSSSEGLSLWKAILFFVLSGGVVLAAAAYLIFPIIRRDTAATTESLASVTPLSESQILESTPIPTLAAVQDATTYPDSTPLPSTNAEQIQIGTLVLQSRDGELFVSSGDRTIRRFSSGGGKWFAIAENILETSPEILPPAASDPSILTRAGSAEVRTLGVDGRTTLRTLSQDLRSAFFTDSQDSLVLVEGQSDGSGAITAIRSQDGTTVSILLREMLLPRFATKVGSLPSYLTRGRIGFATGGDLFRETVFKGLSSPEGTAFREDSGKFKRVCEVELKSTSLSPDALRALASLDLSSPNLTEASVVAMRALAKRAYYARCAGESAGLPDLFEKLSPSVQSALFRSDDIRPPSITADTLLARARTLANAGDFRAAAALFQLLADSGSAQAQTLLARMYLRGDGVARDPTRALPLLNAAVAQNNERARYLLGKMYLLGDGVPEDEPRGLQMIRQAASAGSDDAREFLAQKR